MHRNSISALCFFVLLFTCFNSASAKEIEKSEVSPGFVARDIKYGDVMQSCVLNTYFDKENSDSIVISVSLNGGRGLKGMRFWSSISVSGDIPASNIEDITIVTSWGRKLTEEERESKPNILYEGEGAVDMAIFENATIPAIKGMRNIIWWPQSVSLKSGERISLPLQYRVNQKQTNLLGECVNELLGKKS